MLEGGKKEYEEKQDNISGTKLSQNRSENYHQILLLCLAGLAGMGWVKNRLNASDIKSGVPQKKDFVARCVEEPFKKLKNIRGM